MKLTINDFMPTERKCASLLREMRWGNSPVRCMFCNSVKVVSNGTYMKHYHKFMCRGCGKSFNEKTGTIFEDSKMAVNEWLYLAKCLLEGKSINQASMELGRAYQHVLHAAHNIMDNVFIKRLVELSGEDVEVDEMYQSAGRKGTKQVSREPRKRGLKLRGRGTYDKDKPPIVAAVERGGKAAIEVFRNLNGKNLDAFLYFIAGRFTHTDEFRLYDHLDNEQGTVHESVNHSRKKYAECYKFTNTVEGMFQGLRDWLRTYKGVCKKNLYKFVALFQFRYNNRWVTPFGLLESLLACMYQ